MMSFAAGTALVTVAAGGWYFGSQAAPQDGDDTGGTGEAGVAGAASHGPTVEPPGADRGGVNLLEGNRDNEAGYLLLDGGGPHSIQLFGSEEPRGPEEEINELRRDGEVYAALTFTSAVVEDGDVVLEGEGVYARDSGDLVVHSQDFRAEVFASGYFSGTDRPEPDEYAPEEDEVVLVLSPEQPSGEFRLTFAGMPPRSLLRYFIEEENLNGGESWWGSGGIVMMKCVNAQDPDGPGVNPAHQGGDCDPDWV